MKNNIKNQEAYQRAKKRVGAKLGFYIHLIAYMTVGIILIIINLSTPSDYLWFIWPLLGWGIGVLFHALAIFVFSEKSAFTEEMIEKEMEKEGLLEEKF